MQNTSMPTSDTPDPSTRLNSLSLIDPHLFAAMDVDFECNPPPPKRARARYIFQRCLKASQDGTTAPLEVYAPPSDSEED